MQMNFNMNIPGLKGVTVHKVEEMGERIVLHVSIPKKEHQCPACKNITSKVHDYRIQKIKHLKWFERLTVLFYKRRRYVCQCGKRFSEKSPFVDKYQRFSKEWNQVVRIRSIKAKTFKEAAEVLGTSSSTVIRRFKEVVKEQLNEGVHLPKCIAIDEYKADTDAGTYQLIIANAETHEPIDILPNRRKETIKDYLMKYGADVEIVVMDMNPSFKAAVRKTLNRPIIIADRFHYCRYIYWALDEVRRNVQKEWHAYDRKKCKKMRHVLYKRFDKLTETNRWYLNRYIGMSKELKQAYELKEAYCEWFDWAKTSNDLIEIKKRLEAFYRKVEEANIPAFLKAIQTLKNWQVEILNSLSFGYSNGFLEGINNKSKVLKRNAYGFRSYEHFKAKILLNNLSKKIGIHLG
ncbi:ISL3 family transposase [Lysinibacillus composti]|uniref:ISL3 family transposase n=2 Tax=Lysinibacillus TaxID=400634 RepID=A0A3N9UI57_9BACI|nr:ISL3 family transposase [Lysinibacillus composti]RQW70506.1 ISL3 family transposase [Lysinibacillus composti]